MKASSIGHWLALQLLISALTGWCHSDLFRDLEAKRKLWESDLKQRTYVSLSKNELFMVSQ